MATIKIEIERPCGDCGEVYSDYDKCGDVKYYCGKYDDIELCEGKYEEPLLCDECQQCLDAEEK